MIHSDIKRHFNELHFQNQIFVEPSTFVEKARHSGTTVRRRRRRWRRPQIFTLWLKFLKFK